MSISTAGKFKRVSEKEFLRMGGKLGPRPHGGFALVGLLKVESRDGDTWAFGLFEKDGTGDPPFRQPLFAVTPSGFPDRDN